MSFTIGGIICYVLLAATLLVLPGVALLRLCVPRRYLDPLCRLTIAPGITVAINVIAFTWFDFFGITPGRYLPWILITGSLATLLLVRQRTRPIAYRFRKFNWNNGLIATCLVAVLALLLFIRFRATWGWEVPPGIDTEQHTMIVQLLMEHGGLFQSWAPYNEARTFTYHFGFHAIAATFAWFAGLTSPAAVYIMGRMAGVAAAASLFALVRFWTRSAWGGVFAVVFWELSSKYLHIFEGTGRWTLLTGLTGMMSALVLMILYLRPGSFTRNYRMGLLTGLTAGGVILTQYKSAIIMIVLAACLVTSRALSLLFRTHSNRIRQILRVASRIAGIAGIALLMAAPRLHSVMQAKAGRLFTKIVIKAPPAASAPFDRPTLTAPGILRSRFETPRQAIVSGLAVIGVILIALRRRQALWFVSGWILLTLLMNPGLAGSPRIGLLDEMHWKLALDPAIAVIAGLTIGIAAESFNLSLGWRRFIPAAALAVIALAGAKNLTPVPNSRRYVLPDDMRMMKWIEQYVPPGDPIAGRGYLEHGQITSRDATMWITVLTRHRTNHTNLAAALETGPVDYWRHMREFTTELYARDMSAPESAAWMRDQGFRWFYVGALEQQRDWQLLQQLARNPGIEIAHVEGAAWLCRAK